MDVGEWQAYTLGDLVGAAGGLVKTGPFGSQLHASEYTNDHDGVPVVMPKDMLNGRVDRDSVSRVSEIVAERLRVHRLAAGDLVLARRGDVGRVAFVGPDEAGWLCGTGSMRVHAPDRDVLDPQFLRYAMTAPPVAEWLVGQAVGATMPNLNANIVAGVPIAVPGVTTQRRIAAVLSAFDELIEINERRIELLEGLARSLYREWFVRFRFPGHVDVGLVDSELGPIPEGWEVRPLGQVCSLLRSGGTPRRSVGANWDGGATPWFKTGELTDGPLFDSLEHVTGASGARVFDPPAIFMAIYGAPTVGRLGWVTQPSSCNQAAIAMRANNPEREQDWLWYELEAMRGHFNAMAQGAAQQNISKEKVEGTRVLVPAAVPLESFVAAVRPLRDLWEKLAAQVAKFAATRDLLLPRLVTGRLDISDVDLGVLTPTGAE
jgi:type I restriction enzyme S subunit